MGAEHEGISPGRGIEEMTSGVPGKDGVGVSARRPLRVAALDRVMQDITGDHAPVAHPHAHVARRVPWRFREVDVVGEGRVVCDHVDEPGVDHRPHGIRKRVSVQGISRLCPVVDISRTKQVPRTRECRDPFSVGQAGVPPLPEM